MTYWFATTPISVEKNLLLSETRTICEHNPAPQLVCAASVLRDIEDRLLQDRTDRIDVALGHHRDRRQEAQTERVTAA